MASRNGVAGCFRRLLRFGKHPHFVATVEHSQAIFCSGLSSSEDDVSERDVWPDYVGNRGYAQGI
jgi:hypothetical protein